MLKASWHWGCNSCVLKDPNGEPGRTQMYVGLLSMLVSVDGDRMFSSRFVGELLNNWGLCEIRMNEQATGYGN